MQLHGGNGYSEEYGIERLHRDAHGWAIAGGTPAIQRIRIAVRAARPDLQPEACPRSCSDRRAVLRADRAVPGAAVRGPCSRRVVRRHRRPRRRGGPVRPGHPPAARRVRTRRRGRRGAATAVGYETVDSLAVTVVREAFAFESAHLDSMFAMQGHRQLRRLRTHGSDAVRKHLAAQGRQPRRHRRPRAHRAGRRLRPARDHDERRRSTATRSSSTVTSRSSPTPVTPTSTASCAARATATRSCFVPASTPGCDHHRPHQIIAPHVLGDVVFEDVRVPLDHRLGEPGQRLQADALDARDLPRLGRRAPPWAWPRPRSRRRLAHTTSREQFGMPLARLGGVPASLATSWVEIEMARAIDLPRRRGGRPRPARLRCTSRRWPRSAPPRWPAGSWTGRSR